MPHYLCPVCGYGNLEEEPYGNGSGSDEICPSCGYQFGYTDLDSGITHEQWREQWIKNGMSWDGIGIRPPVGWSPRQQLQNIGIFIP